MSCLIEQLWPILKLQCTTFVCGAVAQGSYLPHQLLCVGFPAGLGHLLGTCSLICSRMPSS